MKYWEKMLEVYRNSDIDFNLDQYESLSEISSEEFGKAFKEDVDKVFKDEVTKDKLENLMWGASSFPMQPRDDKLESFQAWLGGFIAESEEGDGTVKSAIAIAHKEVEESMANRRD